MQSSPTKALHQQCTRGSLYDPLVASGHVLRVPRPDVLGSRQEYSHREFDMTYADRFHWPDFVWRSLSSLQRDRLLRNVKRLSASSHMSGVGGMELILWQVSEFLNENVLNRHSSPLDLRTCHACDKARHSLAALVQMDDCCRPMRIHRSIEDRLPLELAMHLEDLLPDAADLVDAQRMRYREIKETIFAFYNKSPHLANTSFCEIHNKDCKLFSTAVEPHPLLGMLILLRMTPTLTLRFCPSMLQV